MLDRLKLQYNDPKRSLDLRYRHQYVNDDEYEKGGLGDIFDGNLYKKIIDDGEYFNDEYDIALIGLTDRY